MTNPAPATTEHTATGDGIEKDGIEVPLGETGELTSAPAPDDLGLMLPPVNIAVQVVPTAGGKQFVTVIIQNVHGQFELPLTPRTAIDLANQLKAKGREALTGLTVVDSAPRGHAGLIVPR